MADQRVQFLTRCISNLGSDGYPLLFNPQYFDVWNVFNKTYPKPTSMRQRLLQILNFYVMLTHSGVKPLDSKPDIGMKFIPHVLYEYLLALDIQDAADQLNLILRKYRLTEVCIPTAKRFTVTFNRTTFSLEFNIAYKTKRNESIDAALVRLNGSLYDGDVPIQLQERWKPMQPQFKGKARSALPKCIQLMSDSTQTGKLPLLINANKTLLVSRSAEGYLVFRYIVTFNTEITKWYTLTKFKRTVEQTFKRIFAKV